MKSYFVDMFSSYVDGIDTFFYKNAGLGANNSDGKRIRSLAAVNRAI